MAWGRRLVLILAGVMAVLPLTPAEHVHEAVAGHAVVHRHFAPHRRTASFAVTTMDDDDGPVVTLDGSYTLPASATVATPAVVTVMTLPVVALATLTPIDPADSYPIHGPPRSSSSLRAPPVLSRL